MGEGRVPSVSPSVGVTQNCIAKKARPEAQGEVVV